MSSSFPLSFTFEKWLTSIRLTRPLLNRVNRARIRVHRARQNLRKKSHPANLKNFEARIYSQNGEDGILAEIFRRIGEGDKHFVEFGVQDGTECCTRNLLEHRGWAGTWIDGSSAHMESAGRRFSDRPLQVASRFLNAENILAVFGELSVPQAPDLLVIDVDGNDYWFMQKILSRYSPRVLVIEYNASFKPGYRWIMPYSPEHRWDGTRVYSASLTALTEQANRFGYRLVACDSSGVNAFFVKQSSLTPEFSDVSFGDAYHYAPPIFRMEWFGHPMGKI